LDVVFLKGSPLIAPTLWLKPAFEVAQAEPKSAYDPFMGFFWGGGKGDGFRLSL
jgi:hypothetical protein